MKDQVEWNISRNKALSASTKTKLCYITGKYKLKEDDLIKHKLKQAAKTEAMANTAAVEAARSIAIQKAEEAAAAE